MAQIAMIRRELVDQERRVTPEHFNRVFAVYQVLPGPEAHELCVYFGTRAGGRLGGLLAGLGFMLPVIVRAVHRIGQPVLRDPWLWVIAVAAALGQVAGRHFLISFPAFGVMYVLARRGRRRSVGGPPAVGVLVHLVPNGDVEIVQVSYLLVGQPKLLSKLAHLLWHFMGPQTAEFGGTSLLLWSSGAWRSGCEYSHQCQSYRTHLNTSVQSVN